MNRKTASVGELKADTEQPTQLVTLDNLGQARTLIGKANELQLKEIIGNAEAFKVYAQQAKLGLEMQNQCAEVKLRAEKRLGELLKDTPKDNKGGNRKSQSHDATVIPTLKSLGLDKHQSSRYQTVASLPDKEFEEYVAKVKASNEELTTVGVIRLAMGLKTHEVKINKIIPDKTSRTMGPRGVFKLISEMVREMVELLDSHSLTSLGGFHRPLVVDKLGILATYLKKYLKGTGVDTEIAQNKLFEQAQD